MTPDVTTEREPETTGAAEPKVIAEDRAAATAAAQVVLAIIAVLMGCFFAKMVFVILLVSILLAFVLAPIPDLLERIHVPRALGALIAVLVLLGVLFAGVSYSYNAAQEFARELP